MPVPDPSPRRVGVVDIGSNSVRLVAYDLERGIPFQIFNEKALCRLGRGVGKNGRLAADRIRAAIETLTRFRVLVEALQVEPLLVVATAAVREARNGPLFVRNAEGVLEVPVRILSGEDEARLSALGVIDGLRDAEGVTGDLGGGSLELTPIGNGRAQAGMSLPLGPLRFPEPESDLAGIAATIDQELARLPWLDQLKGRTFYAVGGAWRALARAEMAWSGYPLRIIHGYALKRSDAEALAAHVLATPPATLAKIQGVSKARAETLPFAAMLLSRLLTLAKPNRMVFSAQGLREGVVQDGLLAEGAVEDPLTIATRAIAGHTRLDDAFVDGLVSWTEPLFPDEAPADRALRIAACRLANIGFRRHPDYRAEQALDAVLHAPALPVVHTERVLLSLVVAHRYAGQKVIPEAEAVIGLVKPSLARRAKVLGLALRLALQLSAGTRKLLDQTTLEVEDGRLRLGIPTHLGPADAIRSDLSALARAAGLSTHLDEALAA